jgi:hypothetical protein
VGNVVGTVGSVVNGVGGTVGTVVGTVGSAVGSVGNAVGATVDQVGHTVGTVVGSAGDAVGSTVGAVGDAAGSVVGTVTGAVAGAAGAVGNVLNGGDCSNSGGGSGSGGGTGGGTTPPATDPGLNIGVHAGNGISVDVNGHPIVTVGGADAGNVLNGVGQTVHDVLNGGDCNNSGSGGSGGTTPPAADPGLNVGVHAGDGVSVDVNGHPIVTVGGVDAGSASNVLNGVADAVSHTVSGDCADGSATTPSAGQSDGLNIVAHADANGAGVDVNGAPVVHVGDADHTGDASGLTLAAHSDAEGVSADASAGGEPIAHVTASESSASDSDAGSASHTTNVDATVHADSGAATVDAHAETSDAPLVTATATATATDTHSDPGGGFIDIGVHANQNDVGVDLNGDPLIHIGSGEHDAGAGSPSGGSDADAGGLNIAAHLDDGGLGVNLNGNELVHIGGSQAILGGGEDAAANAGGAHAAGDIHLPLIGGEEGLGSSLVALTHALSHSGESPSPVMGGGEDLSHVGAMVSNVFDGLHVGHDTHSDADHVDVAGLHVSLHDVFGNHHHG